MKKYIAYFRLRFSMGLQYRTAALAGMATQFFWGAMEILLFSAFYAADPDAFPMTFQATVNYVWLQQAFLAVFIAWGLESDILESITSGSIAYELCRPVRIYDMWFARSTAGRLSRAALRCIPVLTIAAIVPGPYGLSLPGSPAHFVLFLITFVLSLLVTISFYMLIYVMTFFTISAQGLRLMTASLVEFFSGGCIPLPFFPDGVRAVMEVLPFASMQNVPLRVYSAGMTAQQIQSAIALQLFWLVVLMAAGRALCAYAERRVTLQGG